MNLTPLHSRLIMVGSALLSLLSFSSGKAAETSGVPDPAKACAELQTADFGGTQDAATEIATAKPVPATNTMPAYCQIDGYVAPQVGFELRLPMDDWNGKFVEVGCAGTCGVISSQACDVPLRRGYACIASDMGHRGTGVDALWAGNNLQAEIDWGYRATHVAALAGKAISERYYGRSPENLTS
jgi:Tannase and feruloyl esterase